MAFKLDKENKSLLISLLVDDFVEQCGIQELKDLCKDYMEHGQPKDSKPFGEMKDDELVKQLECFGDTSIGALVDRLVQKGINQKEALMIAHEYSHHAEQKLADDEHASELEVEPLDGPGSSEPGQHEADEP